MAKPSSAANTTPAPGPFPGATLLACTGEEALSRPYGFDFDFTLPTAEVAQRAGFTTLQYMYAVFKRELGITPAACRGGHRSQRRAGEDQYRQKRRQHGRDQEHPRGLGG